MVGNFRPCPDLHDARVLAVAEFAASQQLPEKYSFAELSDPTLTSVSVKVVRADQQVVAGMNYRLLLLLLNNNGVEDRDVHPLASCIGAFAVNVYDHFGTMEVTSWGEEFDCDKAKALLENQNDFFEWSP
jgi:hypothetical protein